MVLLLRQVNEMASKHDISVGTIKIHSVTQLFCPEKKNILSKPTFMIAGELSILPVKVKMNVFCLVMAQIIILSIIKCEKS